jgi:4-diphosphocytidyl-2-C-methyl-D-erythritol kinase
VLSGAAPAKLNLALVVGPRRDDGKHEVVTVVEKLALHDTLTVAIGPETYVDGFADDSLVRDALQAVTVRAGGAPAFAATLEKRIPVAAGLGGGSSDAATALELANGLLPDALEAADLHALAAGLGADVPLFLQPGPVLATGDGTTVEAVTLPRDYHVVLWIPTGHAKASTGSIYDAFDARHGADGFEERRGTLLAALASLTAAADLAALPANDLAASPAEAGLLLGHGAFRAGVTGAGPTLYGLFHDLDAASHAAQALSASGRAWLTAPVGAGDP